MVVEVQDGEVVAARFQAIEFRGFQYLVQGIPAEQMSVIVPRICGVCSTAHHVAAVKALEDAYGVTPPPLALVLRELLMLGQIVQNQATSLFLFTMPDRLRVDSLFDEELQEQYAEIAARALMVRQAGTNLIQVAGGQFIHPVKAVIGGVTGGISPDQGDEMRDELQQALPVACELFDTYWRMSVVLRERIGTWGDDEPACYLAAISDECPNYYGDVLRVLRADGTLGDVFDARDFRTYLHYQESEVSYAGQTDYQGSVLRANSLARVNMARRMGTACADDYLRRFQREFGRPAHAILFYDLARGIELVYALERALEILDRPLDDEETSYGYAPRDGEGYGLVEAPRGPLIHHYQIENGLIAHAEYIIPTVHNVLAIERALRVAAQRYITAERVDMELEHAVGRVVRAFDPCIACATH